VVVVADLEKLPLTEYTTYDPYEKRRVHYKGVLLRELVGRYADPGVQAVRLLAVDDYRITLTRPEWTRWDILLATQMDGRHLSRREKGPVKIVFPYDTAKDIDHKVYDPKWIWQITQIEFESYPAPGAARRGGAP
jgi:hypothetical protein